MPKLGCRIYSFFKQGQNLWGFTFIRVILGGRLLNGVEGVKRILDEIWSGGTHKMISSV